MSDSRTVTIRTTPEGAATIRSLLYLEALNAGAWAAMPDEDSARRTLARLNEIRAHVQEGIVGEQLRALSAPVEVAG